jgi:fluoroacetyl-CoA thioesterase
MPTEALQPGLAGEAKLTVAPQHTAWHMGSGGIEVFATPAMIALMEEAAVRAVADHLPPGWQTVGVQVDVRHTAATPVGLTVTAHAELAEVSGRRLLYTVTAHDGQESIGEGTHRRVLIDLERFEAQVAGKLDQERCCADAG